MDIFVFFCMSKHLLPDWKPWALIWNQFNKRAFFVIKWNSNVFSSFLKFSQWLPENTASNFARASWSLKKKILLRPMDEVSLPLACLLFRLLLFILLNFFGNICTNSYTLFIILFLFLYFILHMRFKIDMKKLTYFLFRFTRFIFKSNKIRIKKS